MDLLTQSEYAALAIFVFITFDALLDIRYHTHTYRAYIRLTIGIIGTITQSYFLFT